MISSFREQLSWWVYGMIAVLAIRMTVHKKK
jgi:hypothetical protein